MKEKQTAFETRKATIFSKIRVALCAIALSFCVGSPSLADDIEIYTGITEAGSGNGRLFQPNLLFVLDTSGSMVRAEALREDFSLYIPTADYGPSGRPNDRVYLYNDNGSYTDISFPLNENFCGAASGIHDLSNPDPSYRDKLLIWQHTLAQPAPPPPPYCNELDPQTDDNDQINSTSRFVLEERFDDINVNLDYELELTVASGNFDDVEFGVLYWDNVIGRINTEGESSNFLNEGPCYHARLEPGDVITCQITDLPSIADEFHVYLKRLDGDVSAATPYDLILTPVTPSECTEAGASGGVDATGDWTNEPNSTNERNLFSGVECAADFAEHGRNSGSTNKFPRYQNNSTNNYDTPKWTSNAANVNVVNWSDNTIGELFLYSENYHQFLQTKLEDRITIADEELSVVDFDGFASDYCTSQVFSSTGEDLPVFGVDTDVRTLSSDRGGHLVRDDTGDVYLCKSRIETLKEVMDELLRDLEGVNVGIARFNELDGGVILAPVQNIDETEVTGGSEEEVVRPALREAVANLPAFGATPIQETMYAAYQYFAGGDVVDPDASKTVAYPPDEGDIIPRIYRTTADLTAPAAKSGSKFVSPISNACQDNSIILLSDGGATEDTGYVDEINDLTRSALPRNSDGTPNETDYTACTSGSHGECLDDLVGFMANNDVYKTGGADDSGENRVYTYTVNFGSDVVGSAQLIDAATAGRRSPTTQHSYDATSARELKNAFDSILKSISVVSADAFVSPAVAVNAFNRLQFRNELYFAIFEPEDNEPRWNGNVKKFSVNSDGEIIGRDGNVAVDSSGFFSSDALSEWPSPLLAPGEADGPVVTSGGAAAQIDVDPARKLFANLDGFGVSEPTIERLTEANMVEMFSDYNIDLFGQTSSPDLETNEQNIAAFTFGRDVLEEVDDDPTAPNYYLGESLHSTPFVIDFGEQDNNQDVLFVTTNQGLLHAIDGNSGQELWAYLPDRSLADNLGVYFNNLPRADHEYGLDGEMTFDVTRDADGSVDRADIFVGQRRGGNKYFAIDVSSAKAAGGATPVAKKWTAEGFPRMAQTWAKPVLSTVNYCETSSNCGAREVVFLMGGYDTDYDNTITVDGEAVPQDLSVLANTVQGNAIYMVDRDTGVLLWMAGKNTEQVDTTVGHYVNDEMVHGFPTEPTLIDLDFDGIDDALFAVDVAGRVWRFDFVGNVTQVTDPTTNIQSLVFDDNDIVGDDNNASKEVAGGIIAELNGVDEQRRFYNRLDISVSPRTDDDLARFNLVTGTGMRPRPLSTEQQQNRLFFLFDRNISGPQINLTADGEPIGNGFTYNYKLDGTRIGSADIPSRFENSDVAGVSTETGATNSTTQAIAPLDTTGINRHGFYIPLDASDSEKMLNPTLTNDNFVLAVSYSPSDVIEDISNNVCQKSAGTSILYQINLTTGAAARIALQKSGISAPPVIIEIQDEDGEEGDTKKILIIGSESFDASGSPEFVDSDSSDIDRLGAPGLGESSTGQVQKVNWWERRRR